MNGETGGELENGVNRAVIDSAAELARRFANAKPFRHVYVDDFFTDKVATALAESFPPFDKRLAINEDGVVGAKAVHEKIVNRGGRDRHHHAGLQPLRDLRDQASTSWKVTAPLRRIRQILSRR